MTDDNGTASLAERIGENRASSGFARQMKHVPFYNGAIAERFKFKRDLITLAKRHGLLQVFTDEVETTVSDESKSTEEIQAMGFAGE